MSRRPPPISSVVTCAAVLLLLLLSVMTCARHPVDMRQAQAALPTGFTIDLNTADVPTLSLLPGIASGLAQRIVDDRTANGPFASVDDLRRVHGIGRVTAERIADFVSNPGSK